MKSGDSPEKNNLVKIIIGTDEVSTTRNEDLKKRGGRVGRSVKNTDKTLSCEKKKTLNSGATRGHIVGNEIHSIKSGTFDDFMARKVDYKQDVATIQKGLDVDNFKNRGRLISDVIRREEVTQSQALPSEEKSRVEAVQMPIKIDTERNQEDKKGNAGDSGNVSKRRKQNWQDWRHKILGWLFVIIAIVVPSAIYGFRNLDVGVDFGVNYAGPINSVLSHDYNLVDYVRDDIPNPDTTTLEIEGGYKVLVYLLARISWNPHFIMFAIQFLTLLFVVLFAYNCRRMTSMSFVTLIYMLVWYYQSFSIVRQSLAMAIAFFAISLFMRKRYGWTLVWMALAFSIHTSSLITLVIIALIAISRSKLKERTKNVIYGVYIGGLALAVLFIKQIAYVLTNVIPILSDRYDHYFAEVEWMRGSWLVMIVVIFFTISALVYAIYGKNKRVNGKLLVVLLATSLISYVLSCRMEYAYRLGYYFEYLGLFLLVPNLPSLAKGNFGKISIAGVCVVVLFGLWYQRATRNWANMYPYRSDILHVSVIDEATQTHDDKIARIFNDNRVSG